MNEYTRWLVGRRCASYPYFSVQVLDTKLLLPDDTYCQIYTGLLVWSNMLFYEPARMILLFPVILSSSDIFPKTCTSQNQIMHPTKNIVSFDGGWVVNPPLWFRELKTSGNLHQVYAPSLSLECPLSCPTGLPTTHRIKQHSFGMLSFSNKYYSLILQLLWSCK